MNEKELLKWMNTRFNNTRSILRLISTKKFLIHYNLISIEKRKILIDLMIKNNPNALHKEVQKQRKETAQLIDLTIRDLRKIASTMGISNYTILIKTQLVEMIQNVKRSKEDALRMPCENGSNNKGHTASQFELSVHACG